MRNNECTDVKYKNILVNNTDIFYREAGNADNPHLLLLHGYPSSSHMFRNLIPLLSEQFHILAPDLPGFGFSSVPSMLSFEYSFENYGKILTQFLQQLNITKTSFYLFDYGAPIIMHLLSNNPSCAEYLIFQNGNIHNEGLGQGIKRSIALFNDNSEENKFRLNKLVELEYIKWEYLNGVRDKSNIAPESYWLDHLLLERKGLKEIHLELKRNYAINLTHYEAWQKLLKEIQPPTLIVWGEFDEVFNKQGAIALHSSLVNSKIIFYPTGHFALEEYCDEIATEIKRFYTIRVK